MTQRDGIAEGQAGFPPIWLPNAITAVRLSLVPLFVVVARAGRNITASGAEGGTVRLTALAVLVAIGVSDVVDGWIARRYGLETQAGAVLDALADKLAQIVILGFFVFTSGGAFGSAPLWLLFVIVARDLILGGGWLVSVLIGRPVEVIHRPHGRISSLLVFGLLLWLTAGGPQEWVVPLSALVALAVTASTLQYIRDGRARGRRVTSGS